MKAYVLIECDIPRHMDGEDIAAYIQDSTRACVGGYHPNDPVFQLDRKSVKAHCIQIARQDDKTDFQNLKWLRDRLTAGGNITIHNVSGDPYGE